MSRARKITLSGIALFFALGAPDVAAQVAPIEESRVCLESLEDLATQLCVEASSIPTLGMLTPLGPELFIDAVGNVGMGTMTPGARLSVAGWIESANGGVRFPDGTQQPGASWGGPRGWTPGEVATLNYHDAGAAALVLDFQIAYQGMVFDGEHVWLSKGYQASFPLTPPSDGYLTKRRAGDGGIEAVYAIGTPAPRELVFDGAHIWGLRTWSDALVSYTELTKVRASDGQVVGSWFLNSSTTPVDYFGLAFDGTNLWVARSSTDEVLQIRPSDGAVLGAVGVGDFPWSLAVDGVHLWVVNRYSEDVTKIRTADGVVLGTYGVGQVPWDIAFDGTAVWIVDNGSNDVTKLRAADGAPMGTFAVGPSPNGIVFDGSSLWVTHKSQPGGVTRLRASDGETLGASSFQGTLGFEVDPVSAVFDGTGPWFLVHEPQSWISLDPPGHELFRF